MAFLLGSLTCPGGDPIEQQKRANEEREDAIQRVGCRVGMPVRGPENGCAEQSGQREEQRAPDGYGQVEPTKTFEPICFHKTG